MSNFTVGYAPECDDDLANVWATASDRGTVTRADVEAARLLGVDPFGCGVHRSEGLYLLVISPLAVTYEIDPVRRHVQVRSIGSAG